MRPIPLRTVAQTLALLLATAGVTLAGSGSAAAAACSGRPGDVNGDGYAEVVIGEVGNHSDAGAVHVLHGSRTGLVVDATGTARDDQYVTEATPGVPGTEKAEDRFGSSAGFGDFDGDGCADLAVAAIGDSTVTVLYGSPRGLVTAGSQQLPVSGLLGSRTGPRPQGAAGLVVADLDDDGTDDLAVVAHQTEVGDLTGGVVVVYGDRAGLGRGTNRAELISPATPGVPTGPRESFGWETALTAGDFDGDGAAELAVQTDRGVQVLRRGPRGYAGTTQPALLSPDTRGVPGVARDWVEFGWALAAGDVDGDGRDDLAVGNPYFHCVECDTHSGEGEGAVLLLRGSTRGLTTAGSQVWTQASPGVAGSAGELDSFGHTLVIGRLDDGPTADLVVAAVRDEVGTRSGAGSVTVLLGSPTGLTTAGLGGTRLHQDVPGLAGAAEDGDGFGTALAVAAVQSGQRDSLLVGVPQETVRGVEWAGLVHQLGTSASGPTTTGSRTLEAGTPGLQGTARLLERFGSSLD